MAVSTTRTVAPPGMLDTMMVLYGGALSASHLDRDPEIVRHATEASRRLLEWGQEAGATPAAPAGGAAVR